MFKLLQQPYPTNDSFWREFRKAAIVGAFVGGFLLVFQPFGINLWDTPNKALKVLGFGMVTFVMTLVNFVVWPRLLPTVFNEERWTVGREIVFIILHLLLIAIANRLYLESLLAPHERSGLNWLNTIVITFMVGIFPVTGLVLFNYIRQLRKYSEGAASLPVHPIASLAEDPTAGAANLPLPATHSTLTLVADNEKDRLTLQAADLLFIESSDNYCTIAHLKDGKLQKPLLRSSLSRLEKQIALAHIVRCHRSYVVNLDRVERVTGNAQGYKLHLLGGQVLLPVARQYNDSLVAELKAL